MTENYTVKQGDHLSKIAKEYGFRDYHTIWDHANNAELKGTRKDPNVLFPGDQLFIPDLSQATYPRGTDTRHRFEVKRPELKLRLVLESLFEAPIANAKCALLLEGERDSLTTDNKGKLEQKIAPDLHDALLIVQSAQTPLGEIDISLAIGDLDPVEEVSGQMARLNNLGYFAGVVGKDDPPAFQSAVEEFQCDQGLKVDGVCGPATQGTLKKVYGC